MINKFCHYCQIKSEAPQRFKFILKKDVDLNYKIIIDIMHLDEKPILHAVGAATAFQTGQFLNNILAKEIWKALRSYWIDTYQSPPDIIIYDIGTNFDSTKFCAEAKILDITYHQISVETYWLIGKIEKYHTPIRRAYDIIQAETRCIVSKNAMLQMAFKAVNDIAGPNGLIPILLIFGADPRIVTDLPLSPSQQQQADVLAKAMTELRKLKAQQGIQNALKTRNGLDTIQTLPLALSLGSKVQIFQEKKGWTRPFKILGIADIDITVDTGNGPVTFRNTYVRPYNRQIKETDISHLETANGLAKIPVDKPASKEIAMPLDYPQPQKSC